MPEVIDVGPRLTAGQSPVLRQAVVAMAAVHDEVVVRVDRVEVYDVAGLGLLLWLHRTARREGARLVVRDAPAPLLAAFRSRGLDRVLVLDDTGTVPCPQPAGRYAAPTVG